MKLQELNPQELTELFGGQCSQECATDDVDNSNSVSGCFCMYNNRNTIENNNSVQGCICFCEA